MRGMVGVNLYPGMFTVKRCCRQVSNDLMEHPGSRHLAEIRCLHRRKTEGGIPGALPQGPAGKQTGHQGGRSQLGHGAVSVDVPNKTRKSHIFKIN